MFKNNTKKDEWVLMSGASSGIGKAFACQLREKGYRIAAVGRTECLVEKFFPFDFLSPRREDFIEIQKFLQVNMVGILINCAGISNDFPEAFSKMSLEKIFEISRCNINSVIYMTKLALESNPRVKILNVSSALAFIPAPFLAVYASSKSYISKFSDSLSREGVDVSVIEPFLVATKMSKVRPGIMSPHPDVYVRWILTWGSYPPHVILEFIIKWVPFLGTFLKFQIEKRLFFGQQRGLSKTKFIN